MSFTTGLVGTLTGAAFIFTLVSWSIHLRHKRKRHHAVTLIDAELGALLQSLLHDDADTSGRMSRETRLQLSRTVTCLGSLHGFERGNARHISEWSLLMLQTILVTPFPATRPRLAADLVDALKLWDDDQRNWRWFRDNTPGDEFAALGTAHGATSGGEVLPT